MIPFMAATRRTAKTNGQALPSAGAMPAEMIVSDSYIGLRDQACAPVTIRCATCPAGLKGRAPEHKASRRGPREDEIREDERRPSRTDGLHRQ
jgi:hypothetical protein